MGTVIHALDAATGNVVWVNDGTGAQPGIGTRSLTCELGMTRRTAPLCVVAAAG